MRSGFTIVLMMLVGCSGAAGAQDEASSAISRYIDPVKGLTLEQALSQAREHEPSLLAIRGAIDVARGGRAQAGLRPNPSMSFERREEPGGTDNLTTVSLSWPLDLFRRAGRIAVADLEVTSASLATADRERLLAAQVRTQYGEVLGAARDVELSAEVIATTQRQLDLLSARVAEGAAPPLDRDVLRVELSRLRADQLIRIGRADAAMIALKRSLGMQPDARLSVRDSLETIVQRESVTALPVVDVSQHVDRRADVRQAAVRVDLAQATLNRAQREGRFDVSLSGSYMRMDNAFPQRGFGPTGELEQVRAQFNYVSAGAMVTLPLFHRNQGEIASAKAEGASAAAALKASRLSAEAEVAAAMLQHDRARQALAVYADGTRTLAKQNVGVVGQSYELGRVTVFDVLAEQRRYLDLENAYTSALRAFYEATTALNVALGEVK